MKEEQQRKKDKSRDGEKRKLTVGRGIRILIANERVFEGAKFQRTCNKIGGKEGSSLPSPRKKKARYSGHLSLSAKERGVESSTHEANDEDIANRITNSKRQKRRSRSSLTQREELMKNAIKGIKEALGGEVLS